MSDIMKRLNAAASICTPEMGDIAKYVSSSLSCRDAALAAARITELEAENARLKTFAAWAISSNTGMSSLFLAHHMLGIPSPPRYGISNPWDLDDFGRCFRLLEAIPEWKDRVHEMRAHSAEWSELSKVWADVSIAYAENRKQEAGVLISDALRRARAALEGKA